MSGIRKRLGRPRLASSLGDAASFGAARTPREKMKFLAALKVLAETAYADALGSGQPRYAAMFRHAAEQACEHDNPAVIEHLVRLRRTPPTMEEFLHSTEFLGDMIDVWPAIEADLHAINPDVFTGADPVHEAYLGGAIGIGKTTVQQITTLYQAILLTCFENPQRMYGLSTTTRLVFPLQSLSMPTTQRNLFKPVRDMWAGMPYVRRNVKWNVKKKESAIEIDGGIDIYPSVATVSGILGAAVPGAAVDEINFFANIGRSTRGAMSGGTAAGWDQASELYQFLSRRRKSRFVTRGISIGCLLFSSSTSYAEDFLDRRINEAIREREPHVLCFRHKQYDVVPASRFTGEKFRLLVGSEDWPTRILEPHERPGEHFPEMGRVEEVPVEYRSDFQRNPEQSLREIIGCATPAISPFITQRNKVFSAGERADAPVAGGGLLPLTADVADLERTGMPDVIEANLPPPDLRKLPHFVHVDFSISGDRCGIAFARQDGWSLVSKVDGGGLDRVPRITVPIAVALQPSTLRNVDFAEVRSWIVRWSGLYGFNLAQVSADGFQSVEFRQQLRKIGIRSIELSVDRTMEPYEYFRRCLYEDRVTFRLSDLLRVELTQLEHVLPRDKVDHPKNGSKDLADAVVGAVYAAATSPLVRYGTSMVDSEGARLRVQRDRARCDRPRPDDSDRPK